MSNPNTLVPTTRTVFSPLQPPINYDVRAYDIIVSPLMCLQYIVSFCSKDYGNYKVPHESSKGSFVFVKRATSNLEAEARTQTHFYHQAQKSSGGPRVARVYEIFNDGYDSTYLVMEFVAAPKLVFTPLRMLL